MTIMTRGESEFLVHSRPAPKVWKGDTLSMDTRSLHVYSTDSLPRVVRAPDLLGSADVALTNLVYA